MRNRISKLLIATTLACTLMGCSDDFLAEKRPYGNFSYAEVYSDWASVKLRLNYIYQKSLPYAKGYNSNAGAQTDNMVPDQWPVGYPDFLSANTEEFEGYGLYTNPNNNWTYSNIHKYFYYGINESPWKKMRECTDVIYYLRLVDSPNLTEEQKNLVEGQARFFRATRYFRLWKRYGGLPIVRTLQSTAISDRDSLSISRQSTKDTYDFMIQDLTYAGENLPARWEEEVNDWGRITSGCAYALAGQIANYYASPVFNRADDAARWQQAYDLNKKALAKLQAGNFGLAYEGNAGTNASNWAKIWGTMTLGDGNVSEGVFVNICNNAQGDKNLYNAWEQQIRPSNCLGSGNVTPTAEMVDLFPMADGKRPTEAGGEYSYNKLLFFLNRDPRFYRTFAFPGVEWKFSGAINSENEGKCPYLSGQNYRLNSFAWYSSAENAADSVRSGFYDDKLGKDGKSIYVRKRSQDQSLSQTPLYIFDDDNGFGINGQPLLITRYTEVLLNFAEAACGVGKLDEAWDALIKVRQRVGYTGDCGLDAAIRSDRARMFEAILYERQIELAYEGKRFDDCHRWMLFDGGVGQGSINNTWTLSGWNGNTCQYLGVTPLNELLLHRLEIMFDPDGLIGIESSDFDPSGEISEPFPAALTLNEDFRTVYNEATATSTYNDKAVEAWANYYMSNMKRKDIVTMTQKEDVDAMEYLNPHWQENLYFMGLQSSDQENNPGVVQTIGWQNRFGGMGVFDPLSDTPITDITNESGS